MISRFRSSGTVPSHALSTFGLRSVTAAGLARVNTSEVNSHDLVWCKIEVGAHFSIGVNGRYETVFVRRNHMMTTITGQEGSGSSWEGYQERSYCDNDDVLGGKICKSQ